MIPDLMDYVIIEKYSGSDRSWEEALSTREKIQFFIDLSKEATDLILEICSEPRGDAA